MSEPAAYLYRASPFARFTDRDVADLVAEYPLAWVCAIGGGQASLLPLLLETDAAGRPAVLVGHMARHNPLLTALRADPRCQVLVAGPQGYVSPQLVADRRWAPTWNYAQTRFIGQIRFDIPGGETLERIVAAMEQGRPQPWTIPEMGPRYERMEQAIIGFRMPIDRLEGRFKLGQDETVETLRRILAGHPDPALVRWMRRFNAARLDGSARPAPTSTAHPE